MSRSLGSRIRRTRKQRDKSAPPLKASMGGTAKRGRQAPGTPKVPRRVARLSEAARRSAADTAQRMDEMGAIRAQQSARPQPQASKAPAPMASPKSTATTAQDLADVGYGTSMKPSTATTAQDLADVGYGTSMKPSTATTAQDLAAVGYGTAAKPAPAPTAEPFTGSMFENPNIDPMREQVSLGVDIPEIPDPIIPSVSGPPEQAGPATTLDYDVWGEDPPAQTPLWNPGDPGPTFDPNQPGQLERDYEFGNITPTTPGIDTPLPGAAPGQMVPDPSYMPPPTIEMSEEEMDDAVSQIQAQRMAEKEAERRSDIAFLQDWLRKAKLSEIGVGPAD